MIYRFWLQVDSMDIIDMLGQKFIISSFSRVIVPKIFKKVFLRKWSMKESCRLLSVSGTVVSLLSSVNIQLTLIRSGLA